jgi:hypothetical protein
MLLLVFLIIIAFILLALMSQSFYLYSKRKEPSTVGQGTLWSGITYLILALALFIAAFLMMRNTKVQYVVEFTKMVSQEAAQQA